MRDAIRTGRYESRSLNLAQTDLLAISATNEMAILRNARYQHHFVSRGTLARMPVGGGAPRDLVEDVQEADWSPDGAQLAVVRLVNGRTRLEYPIGKVLYETDGHISHPRFSPKGDRIAFMDHQLEQDSRGWIAVVDLSGKKTVLSGEWSGEEGLAWSATGNEVWFTANKSGEADAIYAVTLAGKERLVLRVPGGLMLHDIFRDGRVLISEYDSSTAIVAELPGETKGRDLSWMESGFLSDLSADGTMILIGYEGEGAGVNYAVYARKTDGSPAVRLGDGAGGKLSPDGKWALTVLLTPPQLMMLPVGAGDPTLTRRTGFPMGSESSSRDGSRATTGATTFRASTAGRLALSRLRVQPHPLRTELLSLPTANGSSLRMLSVSSLSTRWKVVRRSRFKIWRAKTRSLVGAATDARSTLRAPGRYQSKFIGLTSRPDAESLEEDFHDL